MAHGLLLCLSLSLPGCAFLLPRAHERTESKWATYEEAKAAFDKIVTHQTRIEDLTALGFDPATDPNVRILNYLNLIERFMPNQSIALEDLDPAVRACIQAREEAQALEIDLHEHKARRYGNALLDVTGFVRKTHETGWEFRALLLIHQNRVVYKLASGRPRLESHDKRVNPLGPLQNLDRFLVREVDANL